MSKPYTHSWHWGQCDECFTWGMRCPRLHLAEIKWFCDRCLPLDEIDDELLALIFDKARVPRRRLATTCVVTSSATHMSFEHIFQADG